VVDLAQLDPTAPGLQELRDAVQARCEAAFVGYVGRPADGSEFETFVVLPTEAQLDAGAATAVCLVARRDGQWQPGPARASGR